MTELESRKQAHLDICLSQDVEHGNTRLDEIHIVHKTFPELAFSKVETSCKFLNYKVSAPIFISCMTGGSKEGAVINKYLAEAAEQLNIPLGLGSIRILFEQSLLIPEFSLKRIAPSVPLLANLGAIQIRNIDYSKIFTMLEILQADAIVLHINPAQELYQQHGERDFTGVLAHIQSFISRCPIPVIVKETGYGISPDEVQRLLGWGVRYVDIAGSGGSNWAKIEYLRDRDLESDKYFSESERLNNNLLITKSRNSNTQSVFELGFPTGILMLLLSSTPNVLASGGIRSALDIAKCLILGAESVGLALPIIRRATQDGASVVKYVNELVLELKRIMLLCGKSSVSEMRQVPLWISHGLKQDIADFSRAIGGGLPNKYE